MQEIIGAKIIGYGSALPQKIVTNDDLSKIVETSDEWIAARTGIRERRISEESVSTSDLAFIAADKAIKTAKIDPSEIDLIITGTTSPDTLFPSVSCIVQDLIGARNAAAFDVSAACSGFNYSLTTAYSYIASGQYKNILVIGADTLSKYLDWTDRGTCILFGDGAGAVVLSAAKIGEGILSNHLTAEGTGRACLTMPGGGSRNPKPKNESERCITMDGKEVFKFAVRVLESSIKKASEKAGIGLDKIDLIIPHQANVRIIDHVAKKLKISTDKFFVNLHKYGNTSAASIPIAIDEAARSGRIKKDDIIAVIGFGAGLTCGASIIKWEV